MTECDHRYYWPWVVDVNALAVAGAAYLVLWSLAALTITEASSCRTSFTSSMHVEGDTPLHNAATGCCLLCPWHSLQPAAARLGGGVRTRSRVRRRLCGRTPLQTHHDISQPGHGPPFLLGSFGHGCSSQPQTHRGVFLQKQLHFVHARRRRHRAAQCCNGMLPSMSLAQSATCCCPFRRRSTDTQQGPQTSVWPYSAANSSRHITTWPWASLSSWFKKFGHGCSSQPQTHRGVFLQKQLHFVHARRRRHRAAQCCNGMLPSMSLAQSATCCCPFRRRSTDTQQGPQTSVWPYSAANSSRHITTWPWASLSSWFKKFGHGCSSQPQTHRGVFLQKQLHFVHARRRRHRAAQCCSGMLPSMSVLRHMHSGASGVEIEFVSAALLSMRMRCHVLIAGFEFELS
ncbi:unnamed protein product [Cladocopium goreaui]|uniref:Uncharacterized protein n=1 Tax=Cladocopium goreaui TaxID=2562237 RepID=A0A9P1CM09_9DINO|nr:unnamed protein product [Cladocopium goreaui]